MHIFHKNIPEGTTSVLPSSVSCCISLVLIIPDWQSIGSCCNSHTHPAPTPHPLHNHHHYYHYQFFSIRHRNTHQSFDLNSIADALGPSYYSDLALSQAFQPMAAQLSKKAALPLAKILGSASCRSSKTASWSYISFALSHQFTDRINGTGKTPVYNHISFWQSQGQTNTNLKVLLQCRGLLRLIR